MKFQASGFSVDVPEDSVDASRYVFVFPELGGLPPNLVIRFEICQDPDMPARREQVLETIRESFPNPYFSLENEVQQRGDWQYFTHVFEFGEEGQRLRQKELHLHITKPRPTLYIFSGVDQASNFERFEPFFDAMVRSFQPNEIQRIN